ncbi:LOW QUALITY PROTEIN: transcription initiation factor TFIID subunit 6-like [Pollicipes pollicipes]|uniref:LOW QUALITY PROTEIN: transcription initiation factor TFIID subunit 6-like n=1 Tax=Pollicipes pollicipes TaxID=41117 RepID=UPI0018857224|nr:LOW QUALITY PROTEIN: transcription initiation factor TFIID subunit 6-like [Pollicipes pollicipes]
MKVKHKRSEPDPAQASTLSLDSVRVAAESVGICGVPDDAIRELAEDTTYRLRQIIQDAYKFKAHGKRKKLLPIDFDNALRMRNMEPLYGVQSAEHIPFRFTSGGGRELSFQDDKDVDLSDLVSAQMPKAPLDTTIRVHWLCIDGVQPAIPENPPPVALDHQKQESTNPASKIGKPGHSQAKAVPSKSKNQRAKTIETVSVKQLAQHELSVELQLYYKEITEACVGSDESRRAEALQSLSSDPGLHQMLPRLCNFIFEGVKVNVVQFNLALLIYLMRMVKALLDNQTLYLEKYLHELIPSVASCILSRQLCARPEADNHWALRDFASRLLAQICKNFNTSTNNMQTRVTRLFTGCLQGDKAPLAAHYGALAGLSELGPEVIKAFVMPQLKPMGARLEQLAEAATISPADKLAATHLKQLFARALTPLLKQLRSPPDIPDEYQAEFGHLGPLLCASVAKARSQTMAPPPAAGAAFGAAPGTPKLALAGAGQTARIAGTPQRTIIVSNSPSAAGKAATTGGGKFVIMGGSRPSTPGQLGQLPKGVFLMQDDAVMSVKTEPEAKQDE